MMTTATTLTTGNGTERTRPPDCGEMSFYFVGNFRVNRAFEGGEVVFMIMSVLLSITAITGNLLVLFVFLRTKELRNSAPGLYKLSLALSDLMHGCLVPFVIFNGGSTHEYKDYVRFFTVWSCYFALWYFTTSVSICSLCALTLERLYVIVKRTVLAKSSSRKATMIVITGIWTFSVATSVIPIILVRLSPGKVGKPVSTSGTVLLFSHLKVPSIAFYTVGLGFTVICNIALILAIRKRSNAMREMNANGFDDARSRLNRKAATIILIMSGAFVTSVLPMAIYVALPEPPYLICTLRFLPHGQFDAAVQKYSRYHRRLEVSIWLVYLTSAVWNSIIYSFRDAAFRDAMKKAFRFKQQSPSPDSSRSSPSQSQITINVI